MNKKTDNHTLFFLCYYLNIPSYRSSPSHCLPHFLGEYWFPKKKKTPTDLPPLQMPSTPTLLSFIPPEWRSRGPFLFTTRQVHYFQRGQVLDLFTKVNKTFFMNIWLMYFKKLVKKFLCCVEGFWAWRSFQICSLWKSPKFQNAPLVLQKSKTSELKVWRKNGMQFRPSEEFIQHI